MLSHDHSRFWSWLGLWLWFGCWFVEGQLIHILHLYRRTLLSLDGGLIENILDGQFHWWSIFRMFLLVVDDRFRRFGFGMSLHGFLGFCLFPWVAQKLDKLLVGIVDEFVERGILFLDEFVKIVSNDLSRQGNTCQRCYGEKNESFHC